MRHFRKQLISSDPLSDKFRTFQVTLFFCALLSAFCLCPDPSVGAMDISDEPLIVQSKPPPANIMIVMDDSGSMTFEFLVDGYYEGRFNKPNYNEASSYAYIYDYMGDNAYTIDGWYLGSEGRAYWKSQWYGRNALYYNPNIAYSPWPSHAGRTFSNADMNTPAPNPTYDQDHDNLDLDAASFILVNESAPNLEVNHSHYFLKDNNDNVWLVIIDGNATPNPAIKYYKVTKFGQVGTHADNQTVEKVTQVENPEDVPEEIITERTYDQERQNFANWFTYHRRREYVAKNALALVIESLNDVRVGILGINGQLIVPLKPLNVWNGAEYEDQRDELLEALYTYDSWTGSGGGTPLREGLNAVGQYYKNNSPWLRHWSCAGKAIGTCGDKEAEGDDPPYFSNGGACQQSFTIIMTDGYYSTVGTDLGVDNADGDNDTDWDGGFYGDSLSNALADVAMYYYEKDLNTGLEDLLNDPNLLNNGGVAKPHHQHMVTFGLAFGVEGNLKPLDYNDDPASADFMKCKSGAASCTAGDYPDWPSTITVRSKDTIDDLYHATVNGRGDFLTAKNPVDLTNAMVALIDSILSRLGSASSVSINGDSLYGAINDNVLMFHSSYNSSDWSGDVRAYTVNDITGFIETPAKWSAAESLNAMDWEDRNILSYNGSVGVDFDPAETLIEWETVLGSDYVNIINYVSGQEDIKGFRVRNWLLGDIVHSSPVYENGFVYAGANDGMLHAFQITVTNVLGVKTVSGVEKFAYVPSFVHQNLVDLTLDETPMVHKFFVDLTPTVATGYELLGGEEIDQTILVGGLGKGGKGYFALDITNPTSMAKNKVLWEFPDDSTSSYKPDMGYSFSKPVVVQTNSEVAEEAWVVIAGNGYDSTNGNAILYVLNPQTGSVILSIPTNSETGNGLSTPTAVDINFDRKVDFVFAGDLRGNMWKFDFTGNAASKWSVAYNDGSINQPLFQAKDPDGLPQPITTKPEVMFHPKEHELRKHGLMVLFGTGKFLEELDLTDTQVQTVYGIWDYGDRALWPGPWGRYSKDDDKEYVGAFLRPELSNPNHIEQNVTLLQQTATTYEDVEVQLEGGETVVFDVRVMSGNEPNWYTKEDQATDPPSFPDLAEQDEEIPGHAGWYWDLPLDGERVVSDVLLRDGRLIVLPFTPYEDPCMAGGSSFLMEIDAISGGHSGGIIFDINNDGVIDARDLVTIGKDEGGKDIKVIIDGIKMVGKVNPPAIALLDEEIEIKYLSSSSGAVHTVKEKAVRLGVTYWKELDK
jgi:type IV pilus assembly protein PilY1